MKAAAVRVAVATVSIATASIASVVIVAAAADPALAQMMLPGANNGAAGATPRAAGGGGASGAPPPAPLRPVFIKPPSDEALIGHALARDGKSGEMTFDRSGPDLALSKLKFEGDKISKPQQSCAVTVDIGTPVVAKSAGRPAGADRFDVPVATCPFTIDILDGAVLVSRAEPSCDFQKNDCRITPGGLWGPHADDITPRQIKDLEHQRPRIENTMRANYRALIKKAGKDRAEVKAIAREQAAFSSEREVTCRDYDKESVHGFCSTQITEARALALLAKFGPVDDKAERKHAARAKTKLKPTASEPVPPPDKAAQ